MNTYDITYNTRTKDYTYVTYQAPSLIEALKKFKTNCKFTDVHEIKENGVDVIALLQDIGF